MANGVDIIAAVLMADTGVKALVGSANPRVYPVIAQQTSPLPNIVLVQISDNDPYHLGGVQAEYPEARISVVSRGKTATEMMNVGDAAKDALKNIVHATVSGLSGAADITIYRGPSDVMGFDEESKVFEQTSDFYVRYRPT
jgi:hypothetical protein